MTIEFDDKGKFFTDIVSKTPVSVLIQTVTHRIHGNVHVAREQRLKDELDLDEPFLAITDATVFTPAGESLFRCKFLVVHRSQIIWMIPDSELIEDSKTGGK
jgi:hypothetical protein